MHRNPAGPLAKTKTSQTRTSPETNGRRSSVVLLLIIGPAIILRLWFANAELNPTRFLDEQISFANIESILDTSNPFQPKSYWYQSLSYLPQAGLLAASEEVWKISGSAAFQVRTANGFTPNAYRICRATMVLWGSLSLLLTFWIGRRLFSPTVGLFATFLLAVLPWHIITSARFKPDALLLLLTLTTFWWILDVADQPSTRRFLLAGIGVGLTLSTKLNGGVIVAPLLLLAVGLARHRSRILIKFGLSGIAACAVYLLTNPSVTSTLNALGRNQKIYARQAADIGGSHFEVLARCVTSLFQSYFHGLFIGAAVFAGLMLYVVRAKTSNSTWLFLSFPFAHSLTYAAATERFKENHHVQVTPFTSLLAAYFFIEAIKLLKQKPASRRYLKTITASIVLLIVAGLGISSAIRAFRFVYEDLTPTTFQAAMLEIPKEWSESSPRILCREVDTDPPDLLLARHKGLVLGNRGSFAQLSTATLDGCDALLFAAEKARSQEGRLYLSRISKTPHQRLDRLDSAWFNLRGDSLVLVAHEWQPVGGRDSIRVAQENNSTFSVSVPGCEQPERSQTLSLFVPTPRLVDAWPLPAPDQSPAEAGSLDWFWVRKEGPEHYFVSERAHCSSRSKPMRFVIKGSLPRGSRPQLTRQIWR